jgi:hypothetical protein
MCEFVVANVDFLLVDSFQNLFVVLFAWLEPKSWARLVCGDLAPRPRKRSYSLTMSKRI